MKTFWKFFPFWAFLLFFKLAGSLHYSLLSPYGERLMPLWAVGLLIGGGSFLQLLLDVPVGYLLDRFGYRLFLKVTTISFFFVGVCLLFGLTRSTFILSLAFMTFGWLFFGPGMNAYILSHASKNDSGKFISLREVSNAIGVVIASVVLPAILFLPPNQTGFILCSIFATAFIALCFSPKDVSKNQSTVGAPFVGALPKKKPSQIALTLQVIRKLNPASVILLFLGMSAGIFYGAIWFVVPIVIAHQVQSGLLGFGLGVFDFTTVILGFFLGNLADRFDKRTLVFFGLLLFSLSAMVIGFNFGWLFLLFGFLATTGDEMTLISLWSWLHALDHEHAHDGTVSCAISLFDDVGWMIGPIAAGILYSIVGASWTIVLGAVPIFLTWIVYQFLMRHHKHEPVDRAFMALKPHRARHKT